MLMLMLVFCWAEWLEKGQFAPNVLLGCPLVDAPDTLADPQMEQRHSVDDYSIIQLGC